jgi:hypothetical protein
VYCFHKVHMPLPGCCVSAGTLMLNYGATNMAPSQKDEPILSSKRGPHFRTNIRPWNEQKFGYSYRRSPKPRITMLARASSIILDLFSQNLFIEYSFVNDPQFGVKILDCLLCKSKFIMDSSKNTPRGFVRSSNVESNAVKKCH